jgi:hypothetical protein
MPVLIGCASPVFRLYCTGIRRKAGTASPGFRGEKIINKFVILNDSGESSSPCIVAYQQQKILRFTQNDKK